MDFAATGNLITSILAVIIGIIILIWPRVVAYIIGIYLLIVGVIGIITAVQ